MTSNSTDGIRHPACQIPSGRPKRRALSPKRTSTLSTYSSPTGFDAISSWLTRSDLPPKSSQPTLPSFGLAGARQN
jgi:hypothetical protein